MKNQYLPLTIQNAELTPYKTVNKEFNSYIEIEKVKSNKVLPYSFYRPISKIY
jgi:hypothetical protein